MDTKTPPIPTKHQEPKPQTRKQQERLNDLSLPPLPTTRNNNRQRQRPSHGSSPWSRDAPTAVRYQDHQKKRPYSVLEIGATPLMHACQQGDRARVLRLLKEQEETIGYRDRTLRNALHYCMDAGTGGAVAASAPELVNAADAEGHTPLHLAVIAGDTQLVAVLLANGADVNAKDLEGHSVLHWATVCGEAECVRLVLAAGARPSTPDLRGGSPLHYAAQCCGAAATAELAVPKKVGLKVLQTLLEFGADVNAKDEDGRQPILWAASAGSVEAVLALARAGGTAAAGASDKDGLTALHCAASRGHARCIEALVNLCGSHPDHVDDNGCSALHYAATLGHADATALILKLGADPNRQDRKGRTPALCAAAKGQLETLKILAQHGGSLHARTVRGTGVAHEAVASGRIELIKWLAKRRPSTLDVATHDGKTPLHVAALHGHVDACKVLLDHGARINAVLRTSKGNLMTPLDAALHRGHRDCAKLIQMHGGTTAQQVRAQRTSPNKAKLRIRRTESSTDTESSPTRRRRGGRCHRLPDLYYEERWIERRTRRRGSLRKLARRDSRSFSEEEVRLSKTSSRRDHQRRARSESARYDDDDSIERKLRRRRCKKRSSRHRHERSDSSIDTDSCDPTDGGVKRSSRKVDRSKEDKDGDRSKEDKDGDRSKEGKEEDKGSGEEEAGKDQDDDDESVSDDSLEVVVVKRSMEKKCEKVVSGRRSRTPRESSKETKLTRTHRRTRRKSKSKSRTSENEDVEDEQPLEKTKEEDQGAKDQELQERVVENRYRKDVTDSTSQETVERVVVTALVHKDQDAETPKSEVAKEVTFQDEPRNEDIKDQEDQEEGPEKSKMEDIVEKLDEECSSLVAKAADLRKDVEEMRQQIGRDQDKVQEVAEGQEMTEEKSGEGIEEGRLDVHEPEESPSLDSQKDKPEKEPSLDSKEPVEASKDEQAGSEGIGQSLSDHKEDSSPRTVVQDIPPSEEDEEKSTRKDELKPKEKSGRRKSISSEGKSKSSSSEEKPKSSSDERKSKSSSAEAKSKSSSSGQSDSLDSTGSPKSPKRKRDTRKRESLKKVSIKTEKTQEQRDSLELQKELATPEGVSGPEEPGEGTEKVTPEDKHRQDSVQGNSVDLSKDFAPTEDGAPTVDTPEVKETTEESQDQSTKKSEEKDGEESGKARQGSVEGALGEPNLRYIDESSSSSPKSRSRPSTGRAKRTGRPGKRSLFESSEERSPDRGAIVAVIESPEWDDEDEEVDKEIREAMGEEGDHETEPEDDDDEIGVVRVLPSTSEEETPRIGPGTRASDLEHLPQVQTTRNRLARVQSPMMDGRQGQLRVKQRRDSGGRDSGIEPSPRVSRIPRRRTTTIKYCPNTEKQQALNMETITRDVQISLRRYHLERKIFFQLMELKRLQIRHGRANEHVLVKRQVDVFNKAGMSGPALGVAKYDQPLTFRHFEAFLYEQLRKLQKRPATPDFCTEAKQCTQKTHRCHHATTAYTSVPVYTYLGGGGPERADLLPKIESRGKGQMTVEVTHGEEKQIIALPAERLDRTKRYFVTFTVRGECQETEKPKSSSGPQRISKSV